MKNKRPETRFKHQLMAITLCLAGVTSLAHAEEDSSENIREFLSDPQRVGSLTGIILGGALTAHPAGAVAGSIVGFFVGKQSMFKSTDKLKRSQQTYARRSIIPDSSSRTEPQVLALNGTGSTYTLQQLPQEVETSTLALDILDAQPQQLSPLQQIAAYCYGNDNQKNTFNPERQAMCYYHQSSS